MDWCSLFSHKFGVVGHYGVWVFFTGSCWVVLYVLLGVFFMSD